MEQIALPTKISYAPSKSPNSGTLTVEALYPGYGTTIGNVLRRVLLSSLPGAAVTGVRIKDAAHEFATLPKVQEDALQIIMNLKQLRLKVFSDEPVKLELKAKGEKAVTAADIAKNSEVEIANPDLVIANLTGKDAAIEMEIWVSQGRGYVTTDAREKETRDVGVIAIDSFFSPVRRVSYEVTAARVGQMTNFDKLTVAIDTDGTITGEEAVEQATKIVVDHFAAIGRLEGVSVAADTDEGEEEAEPETTDAGENKEEEAEEAE